LPKGTVDKGESLKQTALREVWEETGLRVKIMTGKMAYLGKFEGGYSFTHYFLAVKVGGSPHPTRETERVALVTWDEALRLFRSGGNTRDPKVIRLARRALSLREDAVEEATEELQITAYPYSYGGEKDTARIILKVPTSQGTAEQFDAILKEFSLRMDSKHPAIETKATAHVAVVARDDLARAAKAGMKVQRLAMQGIGKAQKKWTSAGGVVLDSLEGEPSVYIIRPASWPGGWAYPKGQVDEGETKQKAAVREVFEETGLRAKILPGKSYIGKGEGSYAVAHFYLMVKTGGSAKRTDETKGIRLVTLDEAERLFQQVGNTRDLRITRKAQKLVSQRVK